MFDVLCANSQCTTDAVDKELIPQTLFIKQFSEKRTRPGSLVEIGGLRGCHGAMGSRRSQLQEAALGDR